MKHWIITFAAFALAASAGAQETGGAMLDRDIMTPADIFELTQTQLNFGSARSMAMGGAFTSLGADVSSMATNPAGLGMYRRGSVSLTPMMLFNRSETDADPYGRTDRNRFTMGSVGVIFNAYEGSGNVVSFNIGVGYNRIADFNYRYSSQRAGQAGSIADAFSRQLTWGGLTRDGFYDSEGYWDWNNISTPFWPAALGYKAYLTDQVAGGDDPVEWAPTWIGNNADVGHYASVESRGSIGEYELSLGANIGNKFYIGATIGIQSLHQEKNFTYDEDYVYASAAGDADHGYGNSGTDYQLLYSKFNQAVILDGSGVNFKLGITYRPIENLRIAAAIHTPTFYSLERRYQGAMASMAYANRNTDPNVRPDARGYIPADEVTPELVDGGPYRWEYTSPARLLLGASYTFGRYGVVSVDYERDWYNGIRVKSNPAGLDNQRFYNDTFRRDFKGANIVRVGVEGKPTERLAIRAGFGYAGSMLKQEQLHYDSPTARSTTYYTAGLGFALTPSISLDVAYQYQTTRQSAYYLFYAWDNAGETSSSLYETDLNRHAAALTLAFRF